VHILKILWRFPFYVAVIIWLDTEIGIMIGDPIISLTGTSTWFVNAYQNLMQQHTTFTNADSAILMAVVSLMGAVIIIVDVFMWFKNRS